MVPDDLLHRAILLARAGDKPSARRMLDEVIRADPNNVTAWFWLADAQETFADRAGVLESCLRRNPGCQPVQNALAALQAQLDAEPRPAPLQPEAPRPVVIDSTNEPAPGWERLANPRRVRALSWLYYAFGALLLVGVIALIASLIPRQASGMLTQEAIDLNQDPVQVNIPTAQATPIKRGDWFYTWTLTPRAQYQIAGRVLVNQEYSSNIFDLRSRLCPMDIGLGWKELGDPKVDNLITWWNQSDRTLHFSWENAPPYTFEYINAHISNNHVIPATKNLEAALKALRRNDIVRMEGLLVDAHTKFLGMEFWVHTSMQREDTGQGACETFYVTRLVVNGKEYR